VRESRRRLARRHAEFGRVSPEVGVIDQAAFDELADVDVDAALGLLADLTAATDERLRELALRLAGRVVVKLTARPLAGHRGPRGRLRTERLPEVGGDVDVDASFDVLLDARADARTPDPRDLRGREWSRSSSALCLVVDRSGSMGGARLATAAVAAACVSLRAPADHSVVAFADEALVLKGQTQPRPSNDVMTDLFALRGHGLTNLTLGLRAASAQLAESPAHRRVTLLLSDARGNAGGDPLEAARELQSLGELAVAAPASDPEEAEAFAAAIGARVVRLAGPSSVPEAFADLFAP
jgi:Mg-chelatase subunit ChlD